MGDLSPEAVFMQNSRWMRPSRGESANQTWLSYPASGNGNTVRGREGTPWSAMERREQTVQHEEASRLEGATASIIYVSRWGESSN